MENQNEENERSKTGSDNPVNSSGESGSKPLAHIVAPEKLELQLSVKNLPRPVARAIVNLAKRRKPESGLKTFLKDFLPALTPAATVLISIVALIYTVQQKNRAEAAAKLASLAAERKTLADIIDTFGKTVVPGSTTQSDQQREAHLEVAAMKFATYGDQVLPAMRMALGARDDGLRHGGVLVAQEMYRAKTVEPSKLASQILSYYRVNDPILQLGVLQWLDKMGRELSTNDSRQALSMLKESFGSQGQNCAKQDSNVALEAGAFLFQWSFEDSKDLVLGMAKSCTDSGSRKQAVNTLPKIARSLSQRERDSMLADLGSLLPAAPPDLKGRIDVAMTEIQMLH